MKLAFPLVYDLISHPIAEEEYLNTEPKTWVGDDAGTFAGKNEWIANTGTERR